MHIMSTILFIYCVSKVNFLTDTHLYFDLFLFILKCLYTDLYLYITNYLDLFASTYLFPKLSLFIGILFRFVYRFVYRFVHRFVLEFEYSVNLMICICL
jgi:hypothetical protein